MKDILLPAGLAMFLILPATGFLSDSHAMSIVDGSPAIIQSMDLPANTIPGSDGRTIDIVGSSSNSGSGAGRAKGNSYEVNIDIVLDEAEFWLNFSNTMMLTYYVFTCPDEFGTYTEVYRNSESVTGTGAGWYSSGPVSVDLDAGSHYIIAVSWDGTLTYYFDTGESQATSFGSYTHGYASGSDPLPASFNSLSNDQAIYHQRLTTTEITMLDNTTWGAIKAL
ncbi:MAG: hypothetical protein K8S24_02205 [Candidatus Aegiribacteria sp.]|nr:hypothetical protein [Candidatus Aegiribacteria sp.]